MTVYVVIEEYGFEYEADCTNILGIFTDKNLAEKVVKKYDQYEGGPYDYYGVDIVERELNVFNIYNEETHEVEKYSKEDIMNW